MDDVILVVGLTTNLISISIDQLRDQELCINFDHYEYTFTNKLLEQLMKGTRSSDNFYMWFSQAKDQLQSYMISKVRYESNM